VTRYKQGPALAADAGLPGIGRQRSDRNRKPIEIIMACAAGRISIGEWAVLGSNQ
jgi:hypothetical protein